MVQTLLVLLIVGVIVTGILVHPILVRRQQARLKQRPFPPLWNAIVDEHVPIYSRLSPAERRRLQGHIQVFLAHKQFIGCNGLHITEEMRLTIAAIACLLLLNERGSYFSKLRSILVYPSAYWVEETISPDRFVVEERRVARLGESWSRDQVVLSWDQVKRDSLNWQDGHNIVLHEFAHQLDQEDGQAEGVPFLPHPLDYSQWSMVMSDAYQRLCNAVARGQTTVIDSYGATNPAEFFAVATETFFEKPAALLKTHQALYEQLQQYYNIDPMQWASGHVVQNSP